MSVTTPANDPIGTVRAGGHIGDRNGAGVTTNAWVKSTHNCWTLVGSTTRTVPDSAINAAAHPVIGVVAGTPADASTR
jgi:hypothetical protein